MFVLVFVRRLHRKSKRQIVYYFKWFIAIFIVIIVIKKIFIEDELFRRRTFVIQNDLLNYNEDDLRTEWPFEIAKFYDARDLRTYTKKLKITPNVYTAGLPGEGGFIWHLCCICSVFCSLFLCYNFR